jgi:nitrate reductase delta subunit
VKLTLRALAALLGYPAADLKSNIAEVAAGIDGENRLPPASRARLSPLLARFEHDELLDLQSVYSELFDRSRSLSLHLFEHVHVPVFLEYASCLPPARAREMLGQPVHVFAALAERLDKRGSDYAAIFHCLVALANARVDASARAIVDQNTPTQDAADIDVEWEEAPVSFNLAGAHEMGGPTGVVAKIRASNRPIDQEHAQ